MTYEKKNITIHITLRNYITLGKNLTFVSYLYYIVMYYIVM